MVSKKLHYGTGKKMSLRLKVAKYAVGKGFHKMGQKEFEVCFYDEKKIVPCSYLRNFYVNDDHSKIIGSCALETKICTYDNFNARVYRCETVEKAFRETR